MITANISIPYVECTATVYQCKQPQQVIETDRNGKAWTIMGVMDILPDQTPIERIKRICSE